jgi:M6 family metalloprotease-like protein
MKLMRKLRSRRAVIALAVLLIAVIALTSCGGGRAILNYANGSIDGLLNTSSLAPTAPPEGAMTVKKDAPYAGPYRLPRDRWAFTKDTIDEFQLGGKIQPGVYEGNDPALLAFNSVPVPAGAKGASAGTPRDMNWNGWASPKSGNVKVLILKVKWAGNSSQPVASTTAIQQKFFEDGADTQNVSVREYYKQQSYGQLILSGDVYPQGADDAAYEVPDNPNWSGSLVYLDNTKAKSLINQASADLNFADYDADNNGYIDALVIVYQKFGGNNVSRDHVGSITPTFNPNDFTKDGKKIFQAAFLDYSSIVEYGNGNAAWWEYSAQHEFGHILALPDLYDYGGDYVGRNSPGPDGDESNGCGFWSLMAAGNMTYPIANLGGPAKYCLGWTNADMITSNLKDFHLGPTNSSAENIRRIWRNGEEGQEYFILENDPTADRGYIWYKLSTWIPDGDVYTAMPSLCALNPGLLIWHVDERMWYPGGAGGAYDIGDGGFGCNDWEERKFIDLEESTATYNLNLGADGTLVDDKDYMGGKYDPWPAVSGPNTYNRFAPDTTPDSNAYVQFADTNSYATNVTVNNIRHDGTDAIIDVGIGAPYLHFPEPSPMILTSTASIIPDTVENTITLDYYDAVDALLGSYTAAPWGLDVDTSGISFGNLNVRVHATGALPELATDTQLSYIVDNTPGTFPLVANFDSVNDKLASWASDSAGLFKQQSGGYASSYSFGVYDSMASPNYPNNLRSFAVLPRIALPAGSPTLTFKTKYNLESGADTGKIYISTDNFQTDWTQLNLRSGDPAQFTGYAADWTTTHVRISTWAGQTVSIGFMLETNGSVAGQSTSQPAGWWIDQVVVASGWAESVPFITSTGLSTPANYGQVFTKPALTGTLAATNSPVKFHYVLQTTDGQVSGDITGPPFDLNIDVSTMHNQTAVLSLQAFDSGNIGSPIIEMPVFIFNLIGDVNGDGVVDNADRDALVPLLGLMSADAGYLPWADSNQSGKIDEADMAAVGYFWGSTL